MKKLYFIGGTMGVGKTTVCKILKRELPNCVFLDADWCWDADPFVVTPETQTMVLDNIRHLLNNFLKCSAYENVVFCWVMHQQGIIDSVLSGLKLDGVKVHNISLVCSEEALRERLGKDVREGIRKADVIERSVARIGMYAALDTVKVDVSEMTPAQAADVIMSMQ